MTERKSKLETSPFDPADYLDSPADIAEYLNAILLERDARLLTTALGDVARSKGMSSLERKTGITRKGLYKALSSEGDPKLSTLMQVLNALGLQLTLTPGDTPGEAA